MKLPMKIFETHYDGKGFQLYSDSTFKKFILYIEGKRALNITRWFKRLTLSNTLEENGVSFQLGCNRLRHAEHLLVVTLFISNLPYKMALFDLENNKELPMSKIRYDWLV